MIVTSVICSCGLQRQSNKDTGWPNEALKSTTLHIEHMNSHDKNNTNADLPASS